MNIVCIFYMYVCMYVVYVMYIMYVMYVFINVCIHVSDIYLYVYTLKIIFTFSDEESITKGRRLR